jgi:hypothetical protein
MSKSVIKATFLLAFLLGGWGLAGCDLDRRVSIEEGIYTISLAAGNANRTAAEIIQNVTIDRQNQQVIFKMKAGSTTTLTFISRAPDQWPTGCPANFNGTRMEVFDIEAESLAIGDLTFNDPILVRDCPRDPPQVVLREDGPIGGSGTGCASWDECIFLEP